MRIIFFSNDFFGIEPLKKIYSNHTLLAVVTNKNTRSGRGLKEKSTPIYNYAIKNNINVITTNNLKDKQFTNDLINLKADLFVVIEYKILPKEIFNIPFYGSINLHASILPKYRGAAPIQRALMNGDTKLGLTVFKIDNNIDTGNIITNKEYVFNDKTTYGEAYANLSLKGSNIILDAINNLNNSNTCKIQNNSLATKANKIKKKECKISFNTTSKELHDKIRALHPKPGAFCCIKSKRVKLINSYYNNDNNLRQGQFVLINKKIHIGCKIGTLIIENLQLEGKNIITARDFSNNQLFINSTFE